MIITALYIHPIKSCAALAVAEARLTVRGLEHDRRWMLVDEQRVFLTQRTLPEMALVRVAVDGDALVVERAGHPRLRLPVVHEEGARLDVDVWRDRVPAVRHDHGSDWFSRVLGVPVQLVCMPDDTRRAVDPTYARAGDIVSFADGFPILVVNRASLDALAAEVGAAIDVRRFRPNVVVEGAAAWAEDGWRALAVGGTPAAPALTLRTPKPCARCPIPGIDPDSAQSGKEPLRSLASLRTRDHKVLFGVNAIPDGTGRLHVGDAVRPLDV